LIVLDALDEMDSVQRDSLAEHLDAFLQENIKLYYSSRPDLSLTLAKEGFVMKVMA